MPQQCEKDDDGDGNAQQPKQNPAAHMNLLNNVTVLMWRVVGSSLGISRFDRG
jgi:hypothetical protein